MPHARALFDAAWLTAELITDHTERTQDNDRRLVNAAAAADTDLLVTGDKRVLGWKTVARSVARQQGQMRIVSPRDAWGVLTASEAGH